MNIQIYLNDRVENQINYYGSKSAINKHYYQLFKIMQLVAAALLPFFSIFLSEYEWMKYMVGFLGTMVTVLEGVLATGKYHEKWVMYRSTGETLRQEKFMFLMKAGNYTTTTAEAQFVTTIELILGKENNGWQQMIVKDQNKNESRTDTENTENKTGKVVETTKEERVINQPIDPLTGINNDTEEVQDTK